jgi:hypothetical protein
MREKEEEDRPAPSPSPRSVHSGDGQVGWLTYLWYGAPSHSRSKGWAPRDLLLAGPAGRPVSNSSPGVTGSRGGAQSAPAPPHLSGLTWPLHPLDPVPTGSARSPEVEGRGWEKISGYKE